ncbi:MAG: sugar phosphate isomerase/epimerase [Ktedonobacteraceae bacterium]|nr:sugar phosphate isomerase/epimerase [Ktedonobacteraceae bacterium]
MVAGLRPLREKTYNRAEGQSFELLEETAQSMSQTTQLLCSTGAFSRYPDHTGYQAIQKYGPGLRVDGFEVMFYPAWYGDGQHIATELRATRLRFPAMHAEKNIGTTLGQADPALRERGIQMLKENCQLGNLLGCKLIILHLWNWPELDDDLEKNLSTLGQCYDTAARYNMELALEAIPGRHFDPLTNLHRALGRDVRSHFALDTEFLYNYGQLETVFETPWLWENNRLHHVHIKDSLGQPFINEQRVYLHPGEGCIDFAHFFEQLREKNFIGNISLESPALTKDDEVNVEQLQNSLDFLRAMLY